MTVTPELAPAPPPAIEEAAPPPPRPAAVRRTTAFSLWPWVRLVALVLVAIASQIIYVGFWPLSYLLTQAPDFTYEYLVQYPTVWSRLQVLLARFEMFWPGGSQSLEVLINLLMQAFVGAFLLYVVASALTIRGLPRVWGPAVVVGAPIAFHATLFLMPGLFTTDIFSYAMYGHMAGVIGVNPYTSSPAWYPEVRIFHWIHPLWQNAPSIYGPAWVDLTIPLSRAVANATDVDKVLAYKLVANLAHALGVAALAFATHKLRPGKALESVVLYAWNPLIIFEFGGNGHNDAAMVAVMLLSVGLYASSARWPGIVALAVSVLMKMTSVLMLPFYTMAWAKAQPTWLRFFGVGILAVVSVVATVAAFYFPWWDGPATIGPIVMWSQGPMYNNYVPDILAYNLAGQRLTAGGGLLDPAAVLDETREMIKNVARAGLLALVAWELWRVRGGLGIAGAGARVMTAFLLAVNTWVLPWYFTWPLALAILLGWRSTTALVLLGLSISAPTVMYYHHFWHPYMSDSTYFLYIAPLLIAPVVWICTGAAWGWRTMRRRFSTPRSASSAAPLVPGAGA